MRINQLVYTPLYISILPGIMHPQVEATNTWDEWQLPITGHQCLLGFVICPLFSR